MRLAAAGDVNGEGGEVAPAEAAGEEAEVDGTVALLEPGCCLDIGLGRLVVPLGCAAAAAFDNGCCCCCWSCRCLEVMFAIDTETNAGAMRGEAGEWSCLGTLSGGDRPEESKSGETRTDGRERAPDGEGGDSRAAEDANVDVRLLGVLLLLLLMLLLLLLLLLFSSVDFMANSLLKSMLQDSAAGVAAAAGAGAAVCRRCLSAVLGCEMVAVME